MKKNEHPCRQIQSLALPESATLDSSWRCIQHSARILFKSLGEHFPSAYCARSMLSQHDPDSGL